MASTLRCVSGGVEAERPRHGTPREGWLALAKTFVEPFEKKDGYKPEWGTESAYMSFALWAEAVENAGTFYPPDVITS